MRRDVTKLDKDAAGTKKPLPRRRADTTRRAGPQDGLSDLQRSVGNQAVVELLRIGQPKMEVGPADDPFEREADSVASQVVQALRSQASGEKPDAPGDMDGSISRLQRKAEVGAEGGPVDAETETLISRASTGGTPLAGETRSNFESAFGGADFSDVRLHSGPGATELNDRLSAKAFTVGRDVFFRDGLPNLSTPDGQGLLAHELTHTVQQSGGKTRRSVQRFSVKDVPAPWKKTVKSKKSGSGQTGVVFMNDGSPDPLVVKSTDDPIGETMLAAALHGKVGVAVPETRVAKASERSEIVGAIDKTLDSSQTDQKDKIVADFSDVSKNLFVMGMVKGETFKETTQKKSGKFISLLGRAEYLKQLGSMHAVDLFLGNSDRLYMGNLGNWMTGDVSGAVTAIDNIDPNSKEIKFGPGFKVTDTDEFGQSYLVEELATGKLKATVNSVVGKLVRLGLMDNKELEPAGWPTEGEKKFMFDNVMAGVLYGRERIIKKLAPDKNIFQKAFGGSSRSKTIKKEVTGREGGVGEEGWTNLKARAAYLKTLV